MKHQKIYNRLKRIEGQIRGVSEMLAADKPEPDIIVQLEAAKSSIASATSSLVEEILEIDIEGKVQISDKQKRTLLRLIKKG